MAVRADDGKVLDGSIQAARYCPDGRVSWKQPVGMKNQFLWHREKGPSELGIIPLTDASMVTGVICCGCTTISHLGESLGCAVF
jgi:hypothetical protein